MTKPNYGQTVRLTVAQAVLKYLAAQYSVSDGVRRRFVPAAMGIFGHGNVAGLGQALDQYSDILPFVQGRNEQGLAHAATAFAKQSRRKQVIAVTASVGPGSMNMVTAAALATVNRVPLLLLPGDVYTTRRQGPVLQQLENSAAPDISSNDAFRPVSKFFDRITRPEQLLYSLPQAFRVLASPVDTGAVVISLPQDIQSHAFDFPVEFFEEREWKIRRPVPAEDDVAAAAKIIAAAKNPVIIAGGGITYSGATPELEALANATGIPVCETFGGQSAVQNPGDWFMYGIGLEGAPHTNRLVEKADVVISIGTRLTDFATASQSIFLNPKVKFVSINVTELDAFKQGATPILGDAKLSIVALGKALGGYKVPAEWSTEVKTQIADWKKVRNEAIDPDVLFDKKNVPDSPVTDAVITQGQLIALMREASKPGDVMITAAGGAPGDILKVWDATDGRFTHTEFGYSCMGYEIPAAIGVRFATPDTSKRVISFLGDGTFVMAPTEIVTAAQEGVDVTFVVSENHGYQVIRRLQMWRVGNHYGNEFRYRQDGPMVSQSAEAAGKAPRLEGDYLQIDLVKMAEGMGAKTYKAVTADEVRKVLAETRTVKGPIVIVVPTVQHALLPASAVWWDVAPAEVDSGNQPWLATPRDDYNKGFATQRWHA
jgi:3D-(3,5/4)-trihydroxycyclohexane-1,2-dione acylhydrolase (decyclizing)